ncbi:MAG: helix-turn-helix domain-containing protein, partial [Veillonella sp.]|nr:helix-turn-helix domain-containing protein [Veillonella sp.]
DMYPLYWTTSKGGIFMRYSYEFKRKAIELFYQGEWPKTPAGVSTHTFHNQIREWVKLEQFHGPDINKSRGTNKPWSPKEKYELVCQVLSGQGLRAVAIVAGINSGEYEELIRLRAEIAYIKAENEVIKKEIALREEKEAARLKAKKQRLSKRSANKAIN